MVTGTMEILGFCIKNDFGSAYYEEEELTASRYWASLAFGLFEDIP